MPPAKSHTIPDDDQDDPIINSFDVFIKPTLPDNQELVVLQYITKKSHDPAAIAPPHVLEMRVKPESGFYEVDVPIDISQAYDKNKGMAWGDALHKSKEAKKGGGHGLSAGFNLIPTNQSGSSRGRRGGAAGENQPQMIWAEQARLDRVLRKQTLGGHRSAGHITKDMIGVFQGQNLHLTPISSFVMLQPQFHHIDAATEQEKLGRQNSAAAGGAGVAGDKPGGKAIQMTIKSAMDNADGVVSESIIDRLNASQREPWKKMDWAHEDSEAAWEAYNQSLLVHGEDSEEGKNKEDKNTEGKNKDDSGAADLVNKVPHLKTDWTEEDVLKAPWP